MSDDQERDRAEEAYNERLMRDPDETEDFDAADVQLMDGWVVRPAPSEEAYNERDAADVQLMRRAYKLLYSMLSEAAPYLAKTDFGELNEVMVALDRRVNVH